MDEYFVLDLKHLRKDQAYITAWRPNDCGYAWPLPWAGRYPRDAIVNNLDYYHNGRSTISVPCRAMEALAVAPEPGTVDSNIGPVVENTADNWRILIDAMICETCVTPVPNVKGWRKASSRSVMP